MREARLEDAEAGAERRQLLRRELDRRQVVGVGGQAVDLAAALRRGLGDDLDAEARQLGAVLVEPALEGLFRHQRVALD